GRGVGGGRRAADHHGPGDRRKDRPVRQGRGGVRLAEDPPAVRQEPRQPDRRGPRVGRPGGERCGDRRSRRGTPGHVPGRGPGTADRGADRGSAGSVRGNRHRRGRPGHRRAGRPLHGGRARAAQVRAGRRGLRLRPLRGMAAGQGDHQGEARRLPWEVRSMSTGRYGQGTDDTYERAGFGAPVRRGSRPAIVVVDLARGFTEDAFPSGADLTDVVAATGELIEAGRPAGVPVLYTVIAYTPAEAEGTFVTWLDKARGMRELAEGSAAVELDPRLPVRPSDPVLVKKGASAFFGTSLAASLVGLGCDTVLICGATTSGCVRATAVD